jgi:hypothetical protein
MAEDWALIVHPLYLHTLPSPVNFLKPANWNEIPLHVVHHIAEQFKTAKELLIFSLTCKACRYCSNSRRMLWGTRLVQTKTSGRNIYVDYYREVASDERLWKDLCLKKFGVPSSPPQSWKGLYRCEMLVSVNIRFGGPQGRSWQGIVVREGC